MNFQEYRPLALRTAKKFPTRDQDMRHAVLGLITEIGEYANEVKRIAIYDKLMTDEMRAHMVEELGDAYWYIPLAMMALEIEALSETGELVAESEIVGAAVDFTTMVLTLHTVTATISAHCLEPTITDRYEVVEFLTFLVALLDKACTMLGTTGDEARAANIEKLRKRFPDAYSNEAAEARADKGGLAHTES